MIASRLTGEVREPRLGDIGDAGVEMARTLGHGGEEGAGAAVRGALPLGGRDDEALAGHLALLLQVVEVAGDLDPAVVARLDKAGDQGAGADVRPVGKERRARLGRRVVP